MTLYVRIWLFLCICIACTSRQNVDNSNRIIIDLDACEKAELITNIVDSVVFVPLESNGDYLFGNYKQIMFSDSLIVVVEHQMSGERFLVYDYKGNGINIIDRYGRGPGEYLSYCDFFDIDNDSIYLWDNESVKFLIFNAKDTEYKEYLYPDDVCNGDQIFVNKNSYYSYNTGALPLYNNGFYISELSFNGKIVKNYGKIPDEKMNLPSSAVWYDSLLLFHTVPNKIYQFDGVNITERYEFDFSGKNIPEAVITDNKRSAPAQYIAETMKPEYANMVSSIGTFFENDRWLYFVANMGSFVGIAIWYDKENGICYREANENCNIINRLMFLCKIASFHDEYCYVIIPNTLMMEIDQDADNLDVANNLSTLSIRDDDNIYVGKLIFKHDR